MRWIIYFFGSGAAFFTGIALVLAASALFSLTRNRWLLSLATLTAVTGMLLVGVSATPLPDWLYAASGLIGLAWLVAERMEFAARGRRPLRVLAVLICLVAAGMEIPYHLPKALALRGSPKFAVIGDSVTAGMGGEKTTWPKLLAAAHAVDVTDLAFAGATVKTALRQAESLPDDCTLVLLEIGGNDVLGSTKSADFDRHLAALLEKTSRPDRTVVMFELPLPPGANEFGRIQRQRAAEFGVVLVPKRAFAEVLSGEGATLDSVHLDRRGHERMAALVWSIIRPAYEK